MSKIVKIAPITGSLIAINIAILFISDNLWICKNSHSPFPHCLLLQFHEIRDRTDRIAVTSSSQRNPKIVSDGSRVSRFRDQRMPIHYLAARRRNEYSVSFHFHLSFLLLGHGVRCLWAAREEIVTAAREMKNSRL